MASKRPVVKVDKITGRIVAQYESVRRAADENMFSKDSMVSMLRYSTLTYTRWVFRYADEYKRHESFEGRFINVPIEMFYRGRYLYANSQQEVAKLLHVGRDTISFALSHDKDVCGVKLRRLRFMGDICDDGNLIIRKGEL